MADKDFVTVQETTSNDYVLPQMCYTTSEQVYTPENKSLELQAELPEIVRNIYNSKLNEINNDVANTINSYQDADELNITFDEIAKDNFKNQTFSTITELVERGLPSSMAVELYKTQQAYQQAYGSGLYSALAEARVVNQASNNGIIQASYMDRNDNTASLYESMQNTMVNYQALDDMVNKANARNNERNIATKALVGMSAILPFEENWNAARRFKNIIKNRLGNAPEVKAIGDSWSMNDVAEAGRKALQRAATGSINDFKKLVNDIDQDLLEDGFLTLGDRANFWNQLQNTTVSLNRFAFGAECIGVLPILKGAATAGSATIKSTGSIAKGAVKSISTAAKTSTSLDALAGIAKVSTRPLKALRMVGRKADAQSALNSLLTIPVAERTLDPTATSNAIKNASREWLENGMPSAFSPEAYKQTSSLASSKMNILATAMEGIEDAEDASKAISIANALDDGLIKDIKKEVEGEVLQKFANRYLNGKLNYKVPMEDISMVSTDKGFSLYTVVGTGNNYDKPFTSVKAAKEFADKLNTSDGLYKGFVTHNTAEVVVDSNGPFVKIQRSFLDEDKAATLGDLVSEAVKESKLAGRTKNKEFSKSFVARFMAGANITSDYFTRVLNNLKQADEGRVLRMFNPYFKKLKAVKKSNNIVLDALRDETSKQGAYFTTSALRKAGITEDVIEGYRALKIMDDASWLSKMKSTSEGMLANDVKNIYFGKSRLGLGQIVDRPDRAYINIVTDVVEKDNELVPVVKKVPLSEVKSSNVNFVRLTHAIEGDNIVAINNASFNSTMPSVMDTMFSYKPGRMMFSQNSGFIKQAIPSTVELSNGTKKDVVTDIRTLFSHPAAIKVEKAAETLEAFRQEAIKVSKGKSMAAAQIDIQKIPGWEAVGDFKDFYKLTQGDDALISLHPEAKLVFTRDGEQILFKGEPVKDFNFKGASTVQYTNSERVLNKKMRSDSDIFNPFNFEEAPRLNAMEEMTVAASNMARYSSIDDYTRLYADNFKSVFDKYLDKNANATHNLLYFNPDQHKNTIPYDVRQQMFNAQMNYKRMMSTATPMDEMIERAATKLADKLFPDLKNAGPNRLALYESLSKGNPVRKAKAWTFNWYLSGYNPKQLWTQASASFNAINMHPASGAYTATYHFPILAYMNSNDKSILRKAVQTFGLGKADELQEIANIAKRLDVYTQAAPAGAFELGTREAALSGTSWFDPSSFYLKGEYANRTFTAIQAAKMAYDEGFRASTMTAADFANLVVKQQNLYLNMGRAGTSNLQTGFWGFLTQFKGYQMRFLESMLDAELTSAEKSRLFLGQAVFGGFKGMVGGRYAPKVYASLLGDKEEPYTPIEELAYHGLVDYIAMSAGADKSFGNAWSVGLGDLFAMATETSLAGMPPAASMLVKPVGTAASIYKDFMNYLSLDIEDRDFSAYLSGLVQRFAAEKQLPGGASNLLAGYYALRTGTKLSATGQLSVESQTALDSLLTALGIRDISDDQYSLLLAEKTKLEEDEKEQKKFAQQLLGYALNAPSDDVQQMRLKQVKAFIGTIAVDNPDLANKIFNMVYSPENMRGVKQERYIKLLENMLPLGNKYKEDYRKASEAAFERQQEYND